MNASNYVHLDVERIKIITDKAMILVVEGEEVWIPISQVADPDEYEEGDEDCTVSVTEWIAKQKGLS